MSFVLRAMCILTAAVLLVFPAAASADVITVTGQGDGYYHDESGRSYDFFEGGGTGNAVQYTFWGTSDTTQKNTAYAQFNIASIPVETTIESATLNIKLTNIYIGTSESAGFIHHVADSSAANGSASQKLGGSELIWTLKNECPGWVSVDITDALQSDIANQRAWCCFSFNYDSSGDYSNRDSGFSFASGETSDAAFIQYSVPEPATAVLLGLGVCALRRRKA